VWLYVIPIGHHLGEVINKKKCMHTFQTNNKKNPAKFMETPTQKPFTYLNRGGFCSSTKKKSMGEKKGSKEEKENMFQK